MSRVAHCTDNGPMEGFWGILKREIYYSRKFEGKNCLARASGITSDTTTAGGYRGSCIGCLLWNAMINTYLPHR